MTDVTQQLSARKRKRPFEPFVIVLRDGRRFAVTRAFQYAFTDYQVAYLTEREVHEFFKPGDIAEFESLHPVG